MATKKDLVEAYSFSRRRLVTAFVSGAPGGREVEPARPGRAVVGGIALAILLLAGAAIIGVFKQGHFVDLDNPGLYADDHGGLYVVLDDEPGLTEPPLRQVINVTSAELILGSAEDAQKVSDEDLAKAEKGPPIGILGAPSTPPAAGALINSGWTSCTGAGSGVQTSVSPQTEVTAADDQEFVVRDKDGYHLIAVAPPTGEHTPPRAYAYDLPDVQTSALAGRLNFDYDDSIEVPARWVSLFPKGASLDRYGLDIPEFGSKIPKGDPHGAPAGARYGDFFMVGRTPWVITPDGNQQMSEFAALVLQATEFPNGHGSPQQVGEPSNPSDDGKFGEGTDWPTTAPKGDVPSFTKVCAVLQTAEGQQPAVTLGIDPQGSAEPSSDHSSDVVVTPGAGAVFRSGDWNSDDSGTPTLIDDRGYSYRLADTDVVSSLGYHDVPVVVVPSQWNHLFHEGVTLSREQALCPPQTQDAPKCS